jgi:TRAP-type C4-dicarboxylate transport system substrate-binding protein
MLKPFAEELAAKTGFMGMAIWNRPCRNLSASKPVKTVEDMKGFKVRVPETTMWVTTFKRFGASPTPMPFPEVYTALKTGVIDGQDNPIILTSASGFFEVNKFYNLTKHMYQDNMLLTNQAWFSAQPADIQKAILKAADASHKYCAELSLNEEKRLMEKAIKEQGVTFVETDLSGFRDAVKDMISDFPHVKRWYDMAKSID